MSICSKPKTPALPYARNNKIQFPPSLCKAYKAMSFQSKEAYSDHSIEETSA